MSVSVMYRLEKWIYGQEIRHIGFAKTYRTNERYILTAGYYILRNE